MHSADIENDRAVVRREVRIAGAPDTVFAFLTEPAKVARWCGREASGDLRPGGGYRRAINAGHAATGAYVEIVPDRRIVQTWGWIGSGKLPPGSTTVTISLEADGDQTVLRLTHEDRVASAGAGHAELWDHYLPRLALAASGQDPGPDPWAHEDEE